MEKCALTEPALGAKSPKGNFGQAEMRRGTWKRQPAGTMLNWSNLKSCTLKKESKTIGDRNLRNKVLAPALHKHRLARQHRT